MTVFTVVRVFEGNDTFMLLLEAKRSLQEAEAFVIQQEGRASLKEAARVLGVVIRHKIYEMDVT